MLPSLEHSNFVAPLKHVKNACAPPNLFYGCAIALACTFMVQYPKMFCCEPSNNLQNP